MEFPRFVFVSPGDMKCQGGSVDAELVKDQTEFDIAISSGYSATIPEALEEMGKVKEAMAKAIEPEAPKVEEPKPEAPARGPGRPRRNGEA